MAAKKQNMYITASCKIKSFKKVSETFPSSPLMEADLENKSLEDRIKFADFIMIYIFIYFHINVHIICKIFKYEAIIYL